VHVVTTRRHYKDKVYETTLLRRTYREAGKVKNETVGNLSHLPPAAIQAIRQVLKGERLVTASSAVEVDRSLPHGHVALVWQAARQLGLPGLLGPPGRQRDLALALIVARVLRPASKLATTRWWADTTLAHDLGVVDAGTDEVYGAMDWLHQRQDHIERALARRHLEPGGLALFDLSSSYVEGHKCQLAARGYSRDQKVGKDQIEYGLLTDPVGRPVAVEVVAGNTADPTAFTSMVERIRGRFKLAELVLVGDRGMITSARVDVLRGLEGMGWITCLRAAQIKALATHGPLQLGLFDQHSLAEITHPDFPGERLVCCRNPALAAERVRKRAELLAATEAELAKIVRLVQGGNLAGAAKIGVRVGKVVGRFKVAKHFELQITDTSFAWTRRQAQIDAEAGPGRHLRHPHPGGRRPAGHRRRGRGLQAAGRGGARLPQPQDHRPGAAPDPPLARRPGARPRAGLHAGLLPGLAPAAGAGAAVLHRPGATSPNRPGRCCPALGPGNGQGLPPPTRRRHPHPQLPHPAGASGHPDPQPGPPHRPAPPRHHRATGHPHPDPTPRLRPGRRANPTHPQVVRTQPPHTR
jgi:hypothetical protein